MQEYQKIQTIYKRDEKGKIIPGDWVSTEVAYLATFPWDWTEKIDGTNVRVQWDGERVTFGGRTESAQLPAPLYTALAERFTAERCASLLKGSCVLYGEGIGPKIQGGIYGLDHGIVLFDVLAGKWWLDRETVAEIALAFGISVAPSLGAGSLFALDDFVRSGFTSQLAEAAGEGVVARTMYGLLDRSGERIIVKLKAKDFR